MTTLLTQLRGAFGQAFLLAGLMPAVIGWLLIGWYLGRLDRIDDDVVALVSDAGWTTEVVRTGSVLFGAALALYFLRTWTFSLYSTMTGRWPMSAIRRSCERRQLAEYYRRRDANERLKLQRLALRWFGAPKAPNQRRSPKPPKPEGPAPNLQVDFQMMIGDVRAASESFSSDFVPSEAMVDRMARVATHLYSVAFWGEIDDIREYTDAWLPVRALPHVDEILDRVKVMVYRRAIAMEDLLDEYPTYKTFIRATRLGNLLSALDTYAYQRYGMQTSTMWSILERVIEPEERKSVLQAQLGSQVLINLSFMFLLVAVFILARTILPIPLSWFFDGAWGTPAVDFVLDTPVEWKAILAISLALLGSCAAYGGALFAFDRVAVLMRSTIDLRRGLVPAKFGLEPAATLDEEFDQLRFLDGLFTASTIEGRPDKKLRQEA